MSTTDFQQQLVGLRHQLFYFALSLTRDRDNAYDLTQESMLRALTYSDKFRENTNFKAWVYTIMKNTFINKYRKSMRANVLVDTTDENYFINQAKIGNDDHPESIYNHRELRQVVERLDDTYKVPFMMYYNGFRYKEISKDLDLPIGTVKSRIFLARRKLMLSLPQYQMNGKE